MDLNQLVPPPVDRLTVLEQNLANQSNHIHHLSLQPNHLITQANTATTEIRNPTPVPQQPPTLTAHPNSLSSQNVHPALPTVFNGDRKNGHAFWNSVVLYMNVCRQEFENEDAKIMHPTIQNHVAMMQDQPDLDNYNGWCRAARKFNQDQLTNLAFNAAQGRTVNQAAPNPVLTQTPVLQQNLPWAPARRPVFPVYQPPAGPPPAVI
ncbi:hypothetical protein Clacol_005999 [Clathrus columnatus]|uniref:Uncharacterized protein n=1 Tax=Clathrus columnatus TaxID=1419009 RepID=A0AAV5AAV0_9AGAM|nr:hypothetical protein Clacol_005999 [Clathrus columnatus]